MMKPPHWIRHHWSNWKPLDPPAGQFLGAYRRDTRSCSRCGRRQERYV